MLDRLWGFFGRPKMEAASQLQSPPPPKVRANGQSFPSYLSSTSTRSDSSLPRGDRRLASTDIARLNRGQGTNEFLRELVHSAPDLSASVNAHLRLAITSKYNAVARNPDGTFNREGTNLVQQLLTRFDTLPAEYKGFAGTGSMRSNSEALAKELRIYGACACELILGSDRLPLRLQPISSTSVEFKPDGTRLKPVQSIGGEEVDLDIPTFFYVGLDAETLSAYPSSPMEAAIKPALFAEEFQNQLMRITRRAVHPRTMVKVNTDLFRKYAPPQVANDDEAMAQYQNEVQAQIETQINNLNPEDALVFFDVIEPYRETGGNISLNREWEVLKEYAEARMASGSHTMPAVLGHGVGSSNIASTETLLFIKNVEGSVQFKLNEMYSRMLTLAVRLYGLDVYVEFWYEPIDMRPDSELEAFKQLKQSRLLELLSIGMMEDEEVSLELTGKLPPLGMAPLSGTFFKTSQAQGTGGINTEGATTPNNDGSTLNQNLNPDTPTGAKGQNNKRDNTAQ